jgi:hypothetical protein
MIRELIARTEDFADGSRTSLIGFTIVIRKRSIACVYAYSRRPTFPMRFVFSFGLACCDGR